MEKNVSLICEKNTNGPKLVYSEDSGVKIIEREGLKFKNLAKDGQLHPYEDWRLTSQKRAEDLAARLSIDQIAGLMLYSKHQFIPNYSSPYFGEVTYGGKEFQDSGYPKYSLSDQQKEFIMKDGVRHVLVGSVSGVADVVKWNNNIQALAEAQPFGIPVNNCSDPRHGIDASAEFSVGAGGGTSQWPENIGLAATFDPELVKEFGEMASKEYRALGLTTSLSPQCDLATEPRWFRFPGTFGEDAKLSSDLTRAYCDGFQTSEGEAEIEDVWGRDSVNTMVKHWPGGGCGEGGRDAHFGCGKYSVFPGGNFEYHLKPFLEGAFELEGKTKKASSVMPYYTVTYNQDAIHGENIGSGFSEYLIKDLLRGKYGYDEVICTDWNIVFDQTDLDTIFSGKCWGVEQLSIAERCLKILMVGVDQFGGLSEKEPVMAAYELGVQKYGEDFMRDRFEQSAVRILRNIFRTGLFENPYLVPEESETIVGNKKYVEAGYEAQKKSLIMLKNAGNILPLKKRQKVYVPKQYIPSGFDWEGNPVPEKWEYPAGYDTIKQYFDVTENPQEADAAICFIKMPGITTMMRGYDCKDKENGGNGYVPISLQYRPYTAEYARTHSIAGGDPLEDFTDRSYFRKTVYTNNEKDLDTVLDTKKAMGDKPVIVVIYAAGPMIVSEFEPYADGIIYNFSNTIVPVLDLVSGQFEPSGLLPIQMPKNMRTVEEQFEDVPFDMECYVDSEGNTYDYTFGMNWSGVIHDERVRRYMQSNRK